MREGFYLGSDKFTQKLVLKKKSKLKMRNLKSETEKEIFGGTFNPFEKPCSFDVFFVIF